jgi:hypothetical protein
VSMPSTELVHVPRDPGGRRSRPRAAWRWLLRGWHSQLVRRLALTVALSVAATGLVGLSYATADADPAARRAVTAPAGGGQAAAGEQPARPPGPRAAHRRPQRPEALAVGWYAKRLGVPAGRVRALGSQRLGTGRMRVLVLAETKGRQATAWVPLRRGRAGWTVAR